jgi:uncharacterized FlaG/YvyC family protein
MSAQESTIATLQHQLHQESQRRFEQIEKNQDRQQKVLEQVLSNTSDLPQLKATVEDIDKERNRAKGAVKLAMVLATSSGVIEAYRWIFSRH